MKGLADSLTTRVKPLVGWDANEGIKIFLCPVRLSGQPFEIN